MPNVPDRHLNPDRDEDATSGDLSREELESLNKDELEAMADERGLDVEGTGADGAVLKSDLVNALAG